MADLTHYSSAPDVTQRTTTSATLAEITQYTVAESTLTGAGFAAGDEVLVLVRAAVTGNDANTVFTFGVGRGSSYAGRTDFTDAACAVEAQSSTATRGHHYAWFKKHTLVSGDNWYFSLGADGTNTARVDDFQVTFWKLDDLGVDDWRYDEQTHSSNAPTSYDTSGATVTLPSSPTSNWLILSNVHWLIDSTSADLYHALSEDGADVGEIHWEGEDLNEQRSTLVATYLPSVSTAKVERTRYRSDTSTTHDVDNTKVFALRLNAFEDHSGLQSSSSITHTATSTFQEAAQFAAHPVTTTGDHFVFFSSRGTYNEATKNPFSRIQLSNADIVANYGMAGGAYPHGAADAIPVVQFLTTNLTSGTADLDWDLQEGVDVTPNYSHDYHTGAAFSMKLAATSATSIFTAGVLALALVGSPAMVAGPVSISPGGYSRPAIVGSAVAGSGASVQPAGGLSTTMAGSPTATPGGVSIRPGGVNRVVFVASPSTTAGGLSIQPGGSATSPRPGLPTLTAGGVSGSPSGALARSSVGSATATAGGVSAQPGGSRADARVAGPSLTIGAVSVQSGGALTRQAVGATSATAGAVSIQSGGARSDARVAGPTASANASSIYATGSASSQVSGSPAAVAGAVSIQGGGARGPQAASGPTATGSLSVYASTAAPRTAVASPTVSATLSVSPGGRSNDSRVGGATATAGAVSIQPGGSQAGGSVGNPALSQNAASASPGGSAVRSQAGSPSAVPGAASVAPGTAGRSPTVGSPQASAGTSSIAPGRAFTDPRAGSPVAQASAASISPGGARHDHGAGSPTAVVGSIPNSSIYPGGGRSASFAGSPRQAGPTVWITTYDETVHRGGSASLVYTLGGSAALVYPVGGSAEVLL